MNLEWKGDRSRWKKVQKEEDDPVYRGLNPSEKQKNASFFKKKA